jgi:putative ABC transport system substrate-binding protein
MAVPLAARAQQMPAVGFLHSASLESRRDVVAAFLRGLGDGGYTDGRNVTVEYRWADNRNDRLPALAADLAQRQVAAIFAGGPPPALAAKAATTSLPVVFTSGDDPVGLGLVASLNRPGGNVTGIHAFLSAMEGKRLGLLRELMPRAPTIGAMVNPEHPNVATQLDDIRAGAHALGVNVVTLNARSEEDIRNAFAALRQAHAGALLVAANPMFNSRRHQLVALAAEHRIPAIYELRDYVTAGGLMSYGTDLNDAYRQAGLYVARILKGERPADLPVMQSSKFEFVINLKTARALGMAVPPSLLARADDVVE